MSIIQSSKCNSLRQMFYLDCLHSIAGRYIVQNELEVFSLWVVYKTQADFSSVLLAITCNILETTAYRCTSYNFLVS